MLNNPEMLRSMMQTYPGIREVRERGWGLGQSVFVCGGGGASPRRVTTVAASHTAYSKLTHPPPSAQLTERNPEIAQMLNNPELLRESMRIMANPVRRGTGTNRHQRVHEPGTAGTAAALADCAADPPAQRPAPARVLTSAFCRYTHAHALGHTHALE